MKPSTLAMAAATCLALLSPVAAQAQWTAPEPAARCPSRWGAEDQRGAANHMNNPAVVTGGAQLIKQGRVAELGRDLAAKMPLPGTRAFSMTPKRTIWDADSGAGTNGRGSNEEIVTAEIGQVGTHLDSLVHNSIGQDLYNCFKNDQIATRAGSKKLGVENVGTIFTRGVLIDVAALKGVDMLEDSYAITAQDLKDALTRQKVGLRPGDAVLINTGWGKLWGKDNARYWKTAPGLGVEAAEWLARQDPILVGSDNWGVDVEPNPIKGLYLPIHQIFLAVNGIYILENLKLDELAAQGPGEFAFVLAPLKIVGASGSTVAPAALW